MGEYVKAARTVDVKPGEGLKVEVGGKVLALFNIDGTYFALDHTCPHMGGPLADGILEGNALTCPWHGWTFDVKTGAVLRGAGNATAYNVRLSGDDIEVEI